MNILPENMMDKRFLQAAKKHAASHIVQHHQNDIDEALEKGAAWTTITNYFNHIYEIKLVKGTLYKAYDQARKQAPEGAGEAAANPQPITEETAPHGAEMSLVEAIKTIQRHNGKIYGWKGPLDKYVRGINAAKDALRAAGYTEESDPKVFAQMREFFAAAKEATKE